MAVAMGRDIMLKRMFVFFLLILFAIGISFAMIQKQMGPSMVKPILKPTKMIVMEPKIYGIYIQENPGKKVIIFQMNNLYGESLKTFVYPQTEISTQAVRPKAMELGMPMAMAVDKYGKIYIADHSDLRIVKMDDITGKDWQEFGFYPDTLISRFFGPQGIAVDEDGKIYVAESDKNTIMRMNNTGEFLWISDKMDEIPHGIAISNDGKIYSVSRSKITQMDNSGKILNTFGSLGGSGIAIDGNGKIYVADPDNKRIVQLNDMSGNGWKTFPFKYSPSKISVDINQKIYVGFDKNIVVMDDISGKGLITYSFPTDINIGDGYIGALFVR